MKYLVVSDIHGSSFYANKIKEIFEKENPDKLILLGDLYYHGPRNPFPDGYNPKVLSEILNQFKDQMLVLKGNCDAEVDQMVLDFNISTANKKIKVDGKTWHLTHGHKFNTQAPLPLVKGDILLHGHTHLITCEEFGDENYCLNPGSVAIPKGGNPGSYMIYEKKLFTIKDLDGKTIIEKQF